MLIARVQSFTCLTIVALALLLLSPVQAKDKSQQDLLFRFLPKSVQVDREHNQTLKREIYAASEPKSASISKSGNQPAPSLMQVASATLNQQFQRKSSRQEQKQQTESKALNQASGQASSGDKNRKFNHQNQRVPSASSFATQHHDKTKRKGIRSLIPQTKKLSISSLLPLRSAANSKQPFAPVNSSTQAGGVNSKSSKLSSSSSSSSSNNNNNNLAGLTLTEDQFNALNLGDRSALSSHQLLSGSFSAPVGLPLLPITPNQLQRPPPLVQDYRPPSEQHHHHHHIHHQNQQRLSSAGLAHDGNQHLHLSPNFDAQLLAAAIQSPSSSPLGHHPILSSSQRAPPQEMFLAADQSGEYYQKIRLNKMNRFEPGNSLPFILASTQGGGGSDSHSAASQTAGQSNLNRTALLHVAAQQLTAAVAAAAAAQQQQQQQQQQQFKQSGNSSAVLSPALTSAAAVNLLSERAKNLISQINLAATAASVNKSNNVRNNRETSGLPTEGGGGGQRDSLAEQQANPMAANGSSLALASMLKSAAEAWAATNSMLPSIASGSIVDASPTIIVENDGPTITTLDFGIPQRPQAALPDDDGDDITTNFYSESEESEEGGSHQDRRVVRPQFYQQQASQAPGQQLLRHPEFEKPPSQGSYLLNGASRALVPSANEFFEEQLNDNHHSESPLVRPGPANQPSLSDADYGSRYRTRRPLNSRNLDKLYYPDSINAIKEQDERQTSALLRGKKTSVPATSAASSIDDDPIEHLIRELQDLHKKRKSKLTGGGQRDDGASSASEPERTKERSSLKGSMSDEFDETLNVSGQDKDDGGNQMSDGSMDQEDEQTRILRDKLLARLRAKHAKKGGEVTSSAYSGDSIRIPLHALLLAALDRRMSPSEPKSQSIGNGLLESNNSNSSSNNNILDERNRDLLATSRRDFNEATADLGSLFDGSNIFEQILRSNDVGNQLLQHQEGQQQGSEQQATVLDDSSQRWPLNLQNISQESLTPAGMLLIENLALLDEANQKKHINMSDTTKPDQSSFSLISLASTTRAPSMAKDSGLTSTSSTTTSTPPPPTTTTTTTSSSTTAMPTQSSVSSSLTDVPQAEPNLETNHRGYFQNQNQHNFRNHREMVMGSDGRAQLSKGRRAIRDEGDFDVDRQVEAYANDKYDRSLEPAWMESDDGASATKVNRAASGSGKSKSIEFDDEFDEMERQTKRKISPQRRLRNNSRNKQATNNDEAQFEANEHRFFNKMQRDTDANISDVDKTIQGIERSIPDDEQQQQQQQQPKRGRQRARQPTEADEDEDADGDSSRPLERGDDHHDSSESRDDGDGEAHKGDDINGYEASESRTRLRSHGRSGAGERSPQAGAESQQSTAASKARMVDDEIRRMEQEAKEKRERRQVKRRADDADYAELGLYNTRPGNIDSEASADASQASESRLVIETTSLAMSPH